MQKSGAGEERKRALDRLRAAKAEGAEIDLEFKRRKLAAQQGIYVLADEARTEFGRHLTQLLATIEQRLPDLVGCPSLADAKKWWRSIREGESQRLSGGPAPARRRAVRRNPPAAAAD